MAVKTDIYKTGVYKITCKANGQIYIGSASKSFKQRFDRHKSQLKRNKHAATYLQNSWNKYGSKAFAFEPVIFCDPELCIQYEQILLNRLSPKFNTCKIAGSCLGIERSKETRRKLSEARKCLSDIARRNMALAQRGKKASEETRKKMSEAQKARYKKEKELGIVKNKNSNKRKVTDEQVLEILEQHDKTSLELSKLYKVDQSVITRIRAGRIHKHLGNDLREKYWDIQRNRSVTKEKRDKVKYPKNRKSKVGLTEDNIRAIKNMSGKTQKEIADIFNVSRSLIKDIRSGKSYGSIE